jgi:pimeloyl-ACP methyl ester carboxylesterase
MTTAEALREEQVDVAGCPITVRIAGRGDPLVLLPRENIDPAGLPFTQRLTDHFTVYAPILPGYHGSAVECWSWLADVRDLAITQQQLIAALGLDAVALVGLGFGGWVAAEMASMSDGRLRRLVLVSPMGIQPNEGQIFDQFLVSTELYARTAFHRREDFERLFGEAPGFEQLEAWETDREMSSRIAWKPYMYSRSLPRLLASCRTPSLIVWGAEDRVVPVECAALYADALGNATARVIEACGHAVEAEEPDRLADAIIEFAAGTRDSLRS